jgi:CheY-like chemotaxis protein
MSKKVLLVTNSSTTLWLEQMILKKYTTHEFVTAADGFEAVQRAVKEKPDLVLMDVVMPIMNGFEACRRIKLKKALKQVPVILVTTRGDEQCFTALLESGCTDSITKPIKPRELMAMIHCYLGGEKKPAQHFPNNLYAMRRAVPERFQSE